MVDELAAKVSRLKGVRRILQHSRINFQHNNVNGPFVVELHPRGGGGGGGRRRVLRIRTDGEVRMESGINTQKNPSDLKQNLKKNP